MTTEPTTERYLVIRSPNVGPKALVSEPSDFATRAEAQARIDAVQSIQAMRHHTRLEIFAYSGSKREALERAGILY